MKVVRSQILGKKEDGSYIVAEIVEDVSPEERQGFEVYELKEEEDLTKEEKEQLSKLVRRYLKSYSKHKDKMSLNDWLMMMFREDFPEFSIEKIKEMAKEVLTKTNETYKVYEEVKKAGELGIAPNEYFANKVENSEEFKKIENKKEVLLELDNQLTEQAVDQIYRLSEVEISDDLSSSETESFIDTANSTRKIMGQQVIDNYMGNIDSAIEAANLNMKDTILTKNGSINQNPNLDGFIAESHHANTFNVDATVKELGVRAEDLKPAGAYGKNSVDIVIREGKKIVRKYQAKFGKNAAVTEKYFRDRAGEMKYYFQRKLVPSDQVGDVSNAETTIKSGGAESKPLSKAEVKEMQEKVQAGDIDALNLSFEKDVSTHEVLKRVGRKAARNGIYGATLGAAMKIGSKLVQGEEVEADEVIGAAIKAGTTSGVTTAVHGAMSTAARKGVLKGAFASSTFISAITFSCVEAISIVVKMGNGELTFKEGMDSLGEVFTTGLLVTQAMGTGIATGFISSLASFMGAAALATTVSTVIVGTVVAVAGAAIAKPLYHGAKAVVKGVVGGAKAVVKGGVKLVGAVASGIGSVVKGACSLVGSAVSGVCSFVGGIFGW